MYKNSEQSMQLKARQRCQTHINVGVVHGISFNLKILDKIYIFTCKFFQINLNQIGQFDVFSLFYLAVHHND